MLTRTSFSTCVFAASLVLGGPALAQSANPIDYCRDNSDGESERIECLEAAIRDFMRIKSSDGASAITPPAAEAQTSGGMLAQDGAPAEAAPTGMGAEQVLARQHRQNPDSPKPAAETETSPITEIAVNRSGKYIFFLENGQVWRQKSSDRNRSKLSKRVDYTATLFEGALSGYRMRVSDVRRPFLVERIK